MDKYTLPYFGELDLSEAEDYFEVDATISGSNLNISIDLEGKDPTEKTLDRVKQFLDRLPLHLEKVKQYIHQEFGKTPSFVSDYISFFRETIEENGDFDDYVNKSNSGKSIEEQLINHLYLIRIGIYPSGGAFAILDYTIDDDYTDDLLVIYLTDTGELDGMTIES